MCLCIVCLDTFSMINERYLINYAFWRQQRSSRRKKEIKLLNNSYSDHRSILPQGNTNTNTCYNFKYQIQKLNVCYYAKFYIKIYFILYICYFETLLQPKLCHFDDCDGIESDN